jgi:hypothetical protein
VYPGQAGARKVGVLQIGTLQYGAVTAPKWRRGEAVDKFGARKIGEGEVDPRQIGTGQVGARTVCEVGAVGVATMVQPSMVVWA